MILSLTLLVIITGSRDHKSTLLVNIMSTTKLLCLLVGNKILLFTRLVIVGHMDAALSHTAILHRNTESVTHIIRRWFIQNVEPVTDIAMCDNYWFNNGVGTLLGW